MKQPERASTWNASFGMAFCRRFCTLLGVASLILWLGLRWTSTRHCEGEWDSKTASNEHPIKKEGHGTCKWENILSFGLPGTKAHFTIFHLVTWFEGEWRNDKKHGYGTYVSFSNQTYIGEWLEDMRHGQGEFKLADGTRYFGHWILDKLTCERGTLEIPRNSSSASLSSIVRGSHYEGSLRDGLMHGRGTITFTRLPALHGTSTADEIARVEIVGRFSQGILQGGKDESSVHVKSSKIIHDELPATVYRIVRYEGRWEPITMRYADSATLLDLQRGLKYEWDGQRRELSAIVPPFETEEDRQTVMKTTGALHENGDNETVALLTEAMEALMEFQEHFLFSDLYVHSTIYSWAAEADLPLGGLEKTVVGGKEFDPAEIVRTETAKRKEEL